MLNITKKCSVMFSITKTISYLHIFMTQGLFSQNDKMSYHKISQSFKATRLSVKLSFHFEIRTGAHQNFRMSIQLETHISQL